MSQEKKPPDYKLILNPADGSEVSERATRHAIYLAKLTAAELLLLHVVETNFAWYTGTLYQQVVDQLRDFGKQVLEMHARDMRFVISIITNIMVDIKRSNKTTPFTTCKSRESL